MSDPDLRETWPAFLSALAGGDVDEIAVASDRQQRAFSAALLALDVEALASNIDPAYELHNHSDFFDWRDVYRGVDGMMEWAAHIGDTAGAFEFALARAEFADDRVVTLGEMRAAGRSSGIEAKFPWAQVWTLRGDKILRVDVYTDHDRALAAFQA